MGFTMLDESMQNFDQNHIWHPYTSMLNPLPVYPVESANGIRLKLSNGKELIDGMSSWWACIHGYNHPKLNKAIKDQLKNMSHVMFGGLTHEPAVKLAELLIELTPKNLTKVFFSDSGSVAVEVAMKMALQYNFSIGKPKKNKFLTIKNGYHGDTFNAMSVCDPVTGMHEIFADILPKNYFIEQPKCGFYENWNDKYIKPFADMISKEHNKIAAVILEPIVQGAGGMYFYHPEYLKQVRILCDRYEVLLIADEIATGFGRSGKLFACNYSDISPDIMCLGKAITGGYMSFAATLCSKKISSGISQGKAGVFMHGPTFMGNPLACSVSIASIKLLLESNWKKKVSKIEKILKNELNNANDFENVLESRTLGAIGVIEMKKPVDIASIQKSFIDKGIWVRPFGKLIYIMPPYIINEDDLIYLCKSIIEVIKDMR